MGEQIGYLPFPRGFSTACIHSYDPEESNNLPVVAPLVTSAIYVRSEDPKAFIYGRSDNPTRNALERVLANLDNANYCLTYSAGVAAVEAVLSLVKTGDHVVSALDIYDGTNILLREESERIGFDVDFIDFSDLSNFDAVIKPNTKMFYGETPSNPTFIVTDIAAVARIAKKHNIIFVVDNTFLTPYLQRPLDLGADIALYSLTKYMNGHSDVIMGALTFSDKGLYDALHLRRAHVGSIPGSLECYQVTRSLKTLPLRMQQHSKNALIIAEYLANHPRIEKVLHPGLSSHPGHDIFKKQTSGHSGVFSVYLKGNLEDSKNLLKALKIFHFAGSFGSVESLAHIPALLWDDRTSSDGNFIRLSVGLEDPEDLIADIEQAFLKIRSQ